MKWYWLSLAVLFLTVINTACIEVEPVQEGQLNLSDTILLRKHVTSLLSTGGFRNYLDTSSLNKAAEYIRQEFLKISEKVNYQSFRIKGREYKNVLCSIGPETGERIIIGAHYDVYGNLPGADDNASGVAGLLELGRLLKERNLKFRIDLVAYTLEEPPFFGSNGMGSFIHAQSLFLNKIPVKGMICLEMIGFYNAEPNSQKYPLGFMKWFYGDTGDYITIVQKLGNGSFGRQFNRLIRQNATIKTKFLRSPKFLTGVDFSDHRNYWSFKFNALMVTNSSFYRNSNYHTDRDCIGTLDFKRMSKVVDEVYMAVCKLK
jgi:hypothetical protein